MVVERVTTPDNDFLDIWRLPASDSAPRLVALHGLEGSPRSEFITALAKGAQERGWGMDVVVSRGCGEEMNRAPRYYYAGDSADFATAYAHILRTHPNAPLLLCGVSLGGNMLLKWLGEQGEDLPTSVIAAAAISVPFDLARSCRRIDSGSSRIYSRNFLRTMKPKALAKIAQHPGIASVEAVRSADSIFSLDDAFTAIVHGFRDAADYYTQCSAIRFLERIRVPTLLLSARDDPFHPPEVLNEVAEIAGRNAALATDFPERGGHVGFVGGNWPWKTIDYAEVRVLAFLEQQLAASGAASESRVAS
ncbi:MAG: alpha/beta fold hydrolase [Gemmatimonadaceae bacterium]